MAAWGWTRWGPSPTEGGGVAALNGAVASYIGGVMLYVMAQKAADVAARNTKEDKRERKEERKEDKKDEWQRRECFRMLDEISRLYDRRLSAFWPHEKHAIDQRLNATHTRLQALQKERQ
jgi:hypothetical protein